MPERPWWLRVDGAPPSVERSLAGKRRMAGSVFMALVGGVVLGVGLIGLTEDLFGLFVGVGVGLLVAARSQQ